MGGRGSGSNMGSGTTSMSPAQFDRYVRDNGTEVMYRGYSEGTSASGKGLYFANNEAEASGYVTRRQSEQGHQYGNVATATLRKDTKIADQNTLNSLRQQKGDEATGLMRRAFARGTSPEEGERLGKQSDALRNMDIGTYAKSKGYDALKTAFGETVVLNQKKIIYRK